MNYISINDVQDKFLNVGTADIEQANLFIEDIAIRIGVKLSDIANPVPYLVKRIGVCYACYNCCLASVGTDATTSFDGGSRQDIYAQKLEFYSKELKSLTDRVTQTDFTGKPASGANINLWRA